MKYPTKPFVKWVGGKSQFKDFLFDLIPPKKDVKRFIEPFVGGGAIFLSYQHPKTIINDLNSELTTSYRVLQNEGRGERERERERERETLIELLNIHEQNNSREYFLKLRSKNISNISLTEIAARFIYLNKAGFNGMYRVNKSGGFNVPFGNKEKINTYSKDNIENLKWYLKKPGIKIKSGDYMEVLNEAKKGDFLFVDPPYHDTFTDYTKGGFGEEQQIELSKKLKELTRKGIKWILCNNPTDFILKLYENEFKWTIPANRFINSDSTKRLASAKEVFVTNYIPDSIKDQDVFMEYYAFDKTLKKTNRTLSNLVDWKKVKKNLEEQKFNLNILNIFIGTTTQKEIKEKIDLIFEKKQQSSFQALKLLIAKRDVFNEEYVISGEVTKQFRYDVKGDVVKFIKESKLINLFKDVNNLVDYVYGVEVGLDSNARKNRSGSKHEDVISGILEENKLNFKEQYKAPFMEKKFDFAFKKNGIEYYVEANFYNGQGSKINEVLKSYVEIENGFKKREGKEFIWITDGAGVKSIKKQLLENWNKVNVMNTSQFKEFVAKK